MNTTMIKNRKPRFLTNKELFADKYRHLVKLAVERPDETYIYILPPSKDHRFFGSIDWPHFKGAKMQATMVKAAELVDSYIGKDTWRAWSYA